MRYIIDLFILVSSLYFIPVCLISVLSSTSTTTYNVRTIYLYNTIRLLPRPPETEKDVRYRNLDLEVLTFPKLTHPSSLTP